MESRDENNSKRLGLDKLAVKFEVQTSNEELDWEEMENFTQFKFATIPSGVDKRKTQKSQCTQWPWAAEKNKSSIPIGEAVEDAISLNSPKRYLQYPWSHQHKSKAMDFGSMQHDYTIEHKSQYKADYVTSEEKQDEPTFGICINSPDKRSLSGTNIRVAKELNHNNSYQVDEHQKRWTLKTLDKKSQPKRVDDDQETLDVISHISNLSIDEAIEKLRAEKKREKENCGQEKCSTRPF